MNDDELDKLFDVDEEPDKDDEAAAGEAEAHVDEPEEEVTIEEDKSETISEDDFKDDPEEIKRRKKEEEKRQKAKQRAQAILAAEKYFEENRKKKLEERMKKREARLLAKKDLPPLKDRTFLDDFPLSFRQTMAALIGITVLTIFLMLAFHPMFRIAKINVEGNYALTDEEVIEATGLDYNDHIIKVLGINSSEIMAANPYISRISVSIDFPSGIDIKIEERRKIAYVKYADGYFAIDSEGTVLELSSVDSEDAHPLLCGLDIDNVVLGQKVDITGNTRFQKLVIVLGAALEADQNGDDPNYSFFENVQEIRILPSGMIFMTITLPNGSTLQVKFSEIDSISDDMHWIVFVIEEGKLNDLPDGVLDMTGDQPIYSEYDY